MFYSGELILTFKKKFLLKIFAKNQNVLNVSNILYKTLKIMYFVMIRNFTKNMILESEYDGKFSKKNQVFHHTFCIVIRPIIKLECF